VSGRGWLEAAQLEAGMSLLSEDGQPLAVDRIDNTTQRELVEDLRIEDFHTDFVGGVSGLRKLIGILASGLVERSQNCGFDTLSHEDTQIEQISSKSFGVPEMQNTIALMKELCTQQHGGNYILLAYYLTQDQCQSIADHLEHLLKLPDSQGEFLGIPVYSCEMVVRNNAILGETRGIRYSYFLLDPRLPMNFDLAYFDFFRTHDDE
jgi:hypothetical protein